MNLRLLSWLPDADALDRPCRILFAIAVISDHLHATARSIPKQRSVFCFFSVSI